MKSIRLDDELVANAEIYAKAACRTVPKQIEYWARIGRMAEENPDLPYSFIKGVMIANEEVEKGMIKPYVRRTTKNN